MMIISEKRLNFMKINARHRYVRLSTGEKKEKIGEIGGPRGTDENQAQNYVGNYTSITLRKK